MIIDDNLPTGIIANTAAILGITMGMKNSEVVGSNVTDKDGNEHTGIIQFPVPILNQANGKYSSAKINYNLA